MTLDSLMAESVTIRRSTQTGEDSLGDPIYTWADLSETTAFIARSPLTGSQLNTTEDIVGRDQIVVEWAFMLPPGTDIGPYDRIVADGKTFEVVGQPAKGTKPGSGIQFWVAKGKFVEG